MLSERIRVALVFVLFLPLILHAQGGATGAITGTVQDATGAVVPNAQVQANGPAGTVRSVNTDANGNFFIPLLPAGEYSLSVNASGFGVTKAAGVRVRVTETTRLSAVLRPASVENVITVQAQVANVETTTAATGQSVGSDTIRALPLATQNFQQLLSLSAGTGSNLNQSASLGRGDTRIVVNGQREDNNNYQIEGITASDYNVAQLTNTPLPSPDVVQEFKVQTSMYDATQGRNGGGNINAVLKTGTNTMHGDFFEFFRNDVLNANEYFQKRQGSPRPSVKQNIFGGSLGGPIGTQGKLGYFFVNYQGTRQRSGLSAGTIIGTSIPVLPQDRTAASLASTFFPTSLYPNITPASIDPVALNLLGIQANQFGASPGGFLIPTVAGAAGVDANGVVNTGALNISRPGKYTDDQFTTNYDRDFRGGKDKISGRFFFSNFESVLPFGAGGLQASLGGGISPSDLNFPLDLPVHDRFLNVTETHIFSPRWVNEFRFGYVRINNRANNSDIVTADQLGINRPNNNIDNLIYKFTFTSSGFQIGPTPSANQSQDQNNFVFLDTASWSHGSQLMRMGAEYDRVNLNKVFPQVFNGQVFFSATGPSTDATSLCGTVGCTDFQNFLLGAPSFSFGGSGVANHEYRINNYALFLQDDYKVRPDLTINAGLRWELTGAVQDNLCHIGNTFAELAQQGQNPYVYPTCVNQFNIPGFTGTRNASTLDNNYASNWGPRLGFAYDVLGKHTTSLRGGYGIFYVREDVGTVDQLSFIPPFLPITFASGPPGTMGTLFATGPGQLPVGGKVDPNFIPVYSQVTGFVDASGNPTTDTTQSPVFNGNTINLFGLQVPRHFVTPSTQQWNLMLERSLPANWVAELGYVGTKGTHLRETRDAIQAVDATVTPVTLTATDGTKFVVNQNSLANVNARSRALGLGAGGYQLFANDANSIYHSLQATLAHQFRNGFHFQAAYTYSHAIDETSTGNTAFNSAVNDQTSLRDSRGLSDFDRTHRLTLNYYYQLPALQDSGAFVRRVLGSWFVSGITTFQSGTPFTVIDSNAGGAFGLLGTGTPTTPDLVTSISDAQTHGSIQSRLNGFLNINAFAPAPVVGVDGTEGFGNLGRNRFRGPRQQNWDFTLGKVFHLTERQQLRFTSDFFNLFNHPNFSNPAFLDIESPSNFGQIVTTTGTPRLIQFSARYAF